MKNKNGLVYNFGINDADYIVHKGVTKIVDGKSKTISHWKCPIYYMWIGMIRRCYSTNLNPKFFNSYKGKSVCEEWKYFSNFKMWADSKYFEGCQLDKDLLNLHSIGYAPDSCCIIPGWLNKAIRERKAYRGLYPLGVSIHKERVQRNYKDLFRASLRSLDGKHIHLGYFSTPEDAHKTWQIEKADLIDQYSDNYIRTSAIVDDRVTVALKIAAQFLREDCLHGIETTEIYGRCENA